MRRISRAQANGFIKLLEDAKQVVPPELSAMKGARGKPGRGGSWGRRGRGGGGRGRGRGGGGRGGGGKGRGGGKGGKGRR